MNCIDKIQPWRLLHVHLPHDFRGNVVGRGATSSSLPTSPTLSSSGRGIPLNSSFCPLADVLTGDTVQVVGRAHGGSVTALTPSHVPVLCCGVGCINCRAGQGVGHGCCSWCPLTPCQRYVLFELGDWYLSTSHVKCKNNPFPVIQQQREFP